MTNFKTKIFSVTAVAGFVFVTWTTLLVTSSVSAQNAEVFYDVEQLETYARLCQQLRKEIGDIFQALTDRVDELTSVSI
jgi:hypothetical protein